jgi:hypothetical protein
MNITTTFGTEHVYVRADIQAGGALSGDVDSVKEAMENAHYYGEAPWGRLYALDIDNRMRECHTHPVGQPSTDEDHHLLTPYAIVLAHDETVVLDRFTLRIDGPS